ncbi:MAG: DUF4260 domain-containing protein [Chloroflexaceae bacterium]|nr:DUF4260 domain-containing protein [Chloroflexaceae bacterium]
MNITKLFHPLVLLRVEGLALFAASVVLYSLTGVSWWLFALLLFTPNVAMLSYFISKPLGGMLYNLVHTDLLPIGLALAGWLLGAPVAAAVGLVWLAHIGMDRTFGYGLKYVGDAFKHTHLTCGERA